MKAAKNERGRRGRRNGEMGGGGGEVKRIKGKERGTDVKWTERESREGDIRRRERERERRKRETPKKE